MLAIFCIFHEFVNFRKYFPPPLDLFFSHFSAKQHHYDLQQLANSKRMLLAAFKSQMAKDF